MPNEFWAAIAGAVVGGIIAYLIQLKALNAASAARVKEVREKRKALGYALLFKMVRIHSTLTHMKSHIDECIGKLNEKQYAGSEPWQVTTPIANLTGDVNFSTDEMALLLSLKEDDLFNMVAPFDVIHNSAIKIFRTYAAKREALLAMIPAEMNGMIGSTELSQEQMLFIGPRMAEVNQLVVSMNESCTRDVQESWEILQRLENILNDKLDLSVSLTPKSAAKTP